ncbi:MAG TPA: alpha-amylase family glycosyl hydrolase [Lentimicrobium sp.]|nr:alpha-amylase family glycosyl hydrolase [Lentimicrobium sp.]
MKSQKSYFFLLISVLIFSSVACKQEAKQTDSTSGVQQVTHPKWSVNSSIYEVNVRQYTPEGTFEALEGHLPRIKQLGTDIIWLMPIQPIGVVNRKGTLGSYYSVKDYKAVNPEFGDSFTFKRFVKTAHLEGLKVIIDWVPNHSSWDNSLVKEHPEYYAKDSTGKMFSPFDWTDVVKFDYSNREMRKYMIDAMKYWIENYDIDGFRCDVAGEVPMEFWDSARFELDKLKPVFMLAEAEGPQFHTAFDMTYGWEFHHLMNKIYKGEATPNDIEKYLMKNDSIYPKDAYRMYFITNHDENSWNGTEFERLGNAVETFFALTTLVPGMPLVYTGQEAGMNKRLQFFEKDPVEWGDFQKAEFYKTMLDLKKAHKALFNGKEGGSWTRIKTDMDDKVFVILREKDNNQVLGIFNLSPKEVTLTMDTENIDFKFNTLFSKEAITIDKDTRVKLPGWSYKVLYR